MSEDTGLEAINDSEAAQLQAIATDVLADAKKQGASDAEVACNLHTGLSTTVRKGEVETVSFSRERGVGITVYFGQRKGSASTSDTSPEALKRTVQAACDIAQFTAEDDCAGLADAKLYPESFPDLELFHPWPVAPHEAIEIARECEATALAEPKITNSEGASVGTGQGIGVFATSRGFLGCQKGSSHSMSCVLIAGEQEAMQRDYWYTTGRSHYDLETPEAVANKAVERTLARLNPRKVKTQKTPVLFNPQMASGLLSSFIGAISGGSLYRKTSFLLDSLGEQIFSPFVRIFEQPHLKKAAGSAIYDRDGVATQARDIVESGVLQGYVLSTYSARKLGMETTANSGGVHNLSIDTTGQDFSTLLKEMGTGFYVTELMGQGVNGVTGDYSRGASGFWVEQGEIKHAVQEVTIAGNLKDMFQQILAVGNDVDYRGNIRSGSLLIEQMTVAGE